MFASGGQKQCEFACGLSATFGPPLLDIPSATFAGGLFAKENAAIQGIPLMFSKTQMGNKIGTMKVRNPFI